MAQVSENALVEPTVSVRSHARHDCIDTLLSPLYLAHTIRILFALFYSGLDVRSRWHFFLSSGIDGFLFKLFPLWLQ